MKRFAVVLAVLGLTSVNFAYAAGDAKHGEWLFVNTCEMCHPGGNNLLNPSKPLKGPKFAAEFAKDSKIFATIRNGIPGTVMSPFTKERLSDAQINDIIAYIRTLTPPEACPKPVSKSAQHPAGAKSAAHQQVQPPHSSKRTKQ